MTRLAVPLRGSIREGRASLRRALRLRHGHFSTRAAAGPEAEGHHRGRLGPTEIPRQRRGGLLRQRPGEIPPIHAPARTLARHLSLPSSPSSSASSRVNVKANSKSNSNSNAIANANKEEHDHRVAEAQALVLARLAQRKKSLSSMPVNTKTVAVAEAGVAAPNKGLSIKQRRAVLKAIQHWLSKDPTFFVATMEALDLNLRGPNRENRNRYQNIYNGNSNGNGSKYHNAAGTRAAYEEPHPLQAVWDQYRQLYHESIPKFLQNKLEEEGRSKRGQTNGHDNANANSATVHYNTEIKNIMLEKLNSVGFGDSEWSHRFRQVPNYRAKQEQWTNTIDERTAELHETAAALAKARRSLESLEENLVEHRSTLEAATATVSAPDTDPETGLPVVGGHPMHPKGRAKTKAQKREERRRRKDELRRANTLKKESVDSYVHESTTSGNGVAEDKSFFGGIWESICSSIWSDSGSQSVEKSNQSNEFVKAEDHGSGFGRTTNPQRNEVSINSSVQSSGKTPTEPDFGEFHPFVHRTTQRKDRRLQRRIDKKRDAVRELQATVDRLTADLRRAERSRAGSKPPISQEEYERATVAVTEARNSICREFAEHIEEKHAQSIRHYQLLDAKTDLTKPHEWYSYARLDRRKIIFHGGPTNSGKTYSALERLKDAKKGLYLGPLRLLAAEVYETLTTEGLYTNLFTGQERREIAFSTHTAATVEMCNVNEEYDVVVIDEIQMISDPTRGSAWTKALLGLRCKEIHVCGGLEAAPIVRKLADACGDDFELNQYQRFSDLKVSKKSLAKNPTKTGCYRNVQPGDCIVAFSRNDIFAIKREIESLTNHKCCVIYGKLPPQTRADQARRFNDPTSGYDVLVASDAIGMGLNLNIKRIVFNSIFKFNGEKVIRLGHSDVKQISGRAGRRNSPYPNGEVTCRDFRDLGYVRKCLSTEIAPLRKAALLPTESHIELFAQAVSAPARDTAATDIDIDTARSHPDLHEILQQFSAMATVRGDFFLGRQTEMTMIAKRLKHIPIRLRDAYTMCLSPTTETSVKLLETFAAKVSQNEAFGLPSRAVPRKAKSFDDLSYLCNIYSDVDLFMWLQFKFPPGNAVELATALARKERTMEFINEALSATERLKLEHCYLTTAQRNRSIWERHNGGPNGRNRLDSADDCPEAEDDYELEFEVDDSYEDVHRMMYSAR